MKCSRFRSPSWPERNGQGDSQITSGGTVELARSTNYCEPLRITRLSETTDPLHSILPVFRSRILVMATGSLAQGDSASSPNYILLSAPLGCFYKPLPTNQIHNCVLANSKPKDRARLYGSPQPPHFPPSRSVHVLLRPPPSFRSTIKASPVLVSALVASVAFCCAHPTRTTGGASRPISGTEGKKGRHQLGGSENHGGGTAAKL